MAILSYGSSPFSYTNSIEVIKWQVIYLWWPDSFFIPTAYLYWSVQASPFFGLHVQVSNSGNHAHNYNLTHQQVYYENSTIIIIVSTKAIFKKLSGGTIQGYANMNKYHHPKGDSLAIKD